MDNDELAIPFIIFSDNEGFKISQEAKDFLGTLALKRIGVISVVGKYRTGKSYFINKVLLSHNRKAGFSVGNTVNPCTKGLWIWKKVLNAKDYGGEDLPIIIIDTEGFGGIDEGVNHDTRIFLFSLLLSSYFIYNSTGAIDESSLQSLSLIINLAKEINLKTAGEHSTDEFPFFLWVLRDFSLSIEDTNGLPLSSKEYLENSLAPVKGISETAEAKNRLRRLLKQFFVKRDCITFVRPVEEERQLQKLDQLDDELIRPEFIEQIKKSRYKIFKNVNHKCISNNIISSAGFLSSAEAYVSMINSGQVPSIESAWINICNDQNHSIYNESIRMLDNIIKSYEPLILKNQELEETKNTIFQFAEKNFIKTDELQQSLLQKLKEDIQKRIDKYQREAISDKHKQLEKVLDEKVFELKQDIINGQINSIEEIIQALDEFDRSNLNAEFKEGWDKLRKIKETSLITQICGALGEKHKAEKEKVHILVAEADILRNKIIYIEDKLNEITNSLDKTKSSLQMKEEKIEELQKYSTNLTKILDEKELFEKERTFIQKISPVIGNELEKSLTSDQQNSKVKVKNHEKEIERLKEKIVKKNQKIYELKYELQKLKEFHENIKQNEKDNQYLIANTNASYNSNNEDYYKSDNEVIELRVSNRHLLEQVVFHKKITEDLKEIYEKLLFNVSPNSTNMETANSELLSTNKILSQSLARTQTQIRFLEERLKIFKQFKKICKNASSIKCSKCYKFCVVDNFIEHLEVCGNLFRAGKNNNQKPEDISYYPDKNSAITFSVDHISKKSERKINPKDYIVKIFNDNAVWKIEKNYKDFIDLYKMLITKFPALNFSEELKSNNMFCLGVENFIKSEKIDSEEKRKNIEKFLNEISNIREIIYSREFKKFIALEKENISETFFDKETDKSLLGVPKSNLITNYKAENNLFKKQNINAAINYQPSQESNTSLFIG